jgi:hypothetical protein
MDLTARLWLTLHLRSSDFPIGPTLSDVKAINWPDHMSLTSLIEHCFPLATCLPSVRETRIDPAFTITTLQKICRIKIRWTGNLRDHLSYDRSTETLYIFPHKICLISHLGSSNNVFPRDLLLETIRTLDLLFPFGDEGTQRYLDGKNQTFYRTYSQDMPRSTDMGEFRYWRKQLMELDEVFHQAPKGMLQLWYDRRNPMQWWTFWLAAMIAILTILFGIISSYTGLKQTALAEKAYQLSLIQACSRTEVLVDMCKR